MNIFKNICFGFIPFSLIGAMYHISNGDKYTTLVIAFFVFTSTVIGLTIHCEDK